MRALAAAVLLVALAGCVEIAIPSAPPAERPADPDDGLSTLDLVVVESGNGRPVAGAEVRLSIAGVGSIAKTTAADGSAAFTVEPATGCSVTVAKAGFQQRKAALDCTGDQAYRLSLARTPSASSGQGGSPPQGSSGGTGGNGTPPAEGNGTGEGNETAHRPFEPQEPSGSCGSLGSLEPVAPDPTLAGGLALGWPLLELDVALLADPAFVAAHPDDWRSLLEALVQDANLYYEDQLGLRLNLSVLDRLPDGSLAPGSGDGRQRAVARGFMHANHALADVDMVAVALGADYEGSVAGQVECVHGAVSPDYSYLWFEYDQDRDPGALVGSIGIFEDIPLKTYMHETAHLLAAHHHYSDCAESYTDLRTSDALGVCDIMINDVGLASFRFSPTNRLVKRSFVEDLGIGEPVA